MRIANVLNVAAGNVTVNAVATGMALRGHSLTARADVLTTTLIAP